MKLLLADDHALFRQALRHILSELGPDTTIVDAESLGKALALAQEHADLDLVLLDLKMPDVQGIDSVYAFRERFPSLPIVVLSASEDCEDIEAVLDAGALGFVPKSSPAAVLLGALRLVLEGGVYLPPQLLNRVAPSPRPVMQQSNPSLSGHGRVDGLTERQLEVLRLLEQGKSNKEIARDLRLSEGTIKIHLAAVFRALNVRNRTEAVLAAQRLQTTAGLSAANAAARAAQQRALN
jgi:DNA-binding NarL/FixJ family response regulator